MDLFKSSQSILPLPKKDIRSLHPSKDEAGGPCVSTDGFDIGKSFPTIADAVEAAQVFAQSGLKQRSSKKKKYVALHQRSDKNQSMRR